MNKHAHELATEADEMDLFKTRDRAGVPRKVFLLNPATNEETEHYLLIRSSLSDEFQDAKNRALQDAPKVAILPDTAREEARRVGQLRLRAALVAGWSFKKEFNEANLMEFLREAPQLHQMIIEVADDAGHFFGKP